MDVESSMMGWIKCIKYHTMEYAAPLKSALFFTLSFKELYSFYIWQLFFILEGGLVKVAASNHVYILLSHLGLPNSHVFSLDLNP